MNLIYFTSSYPYGLGEQWKANELNELINHFDNIIVVPYSYGGNHNNPKPLPKGVHLEGPLLPEEQLKSSKKDLLKIFLHKHRGTFLKEFIRKKVYTSKSRFISWFSSTLNVIRLLKHPLVQKLESNADKNTVFYFYWGKGSCEILPFINNRRLYKSFVRMHRYDLFEYENNNYIPYRSALLNSASVIAPSSLAGKQHLQQLYPRVSANVEVFRCGTISNNKLSSASQDGILRVVSCSLLSPVKRVHVMIESLRHIQVPIIWHHVGDGQLRDELETLARKLGVEDKFIFEGMMDSRRVLNFYTENSFDLFVNVSASEGVPFSIMEAFSVGIPVMATDVGGTGEIVNEQVGMLLPAEITGVVLAKKITDFYNLSTEQKQGMRRECYNQYIINWNAEKLANALAVFLKA
ncbi:glycosyltransferase [Niastella caeni]|uniref:Glycosyltransferase n=1 Tax=Niastella caeni TaxID=2569763 RepID=A0A4S8I0J1_9BACT|nr:glycosyltransferase [Niastella caeni]THU41527.1 glycosyltransferase [Niastella caeni]